MTEYITLKAQARDLTGQRFGRLVALGPVRRDRHGTIIWRCICDCGSETASQKSHLTMGFAQSCGCLQRERVVATHTTHGMSRTQISNIWRKMINRCVCPTNTSYIHYGGRGITVCDEWRLDLQAFYDHVSQLPDFERKGYSLDRINNDGNYQPDNVRWATQTEQTRNTRSNHLVTLNGRTQCIASWAEELGIGQNTLNTRLKRGWSVERALAATVQ